MDAAGLRDEKPRLESAWSCAGRISPGAVGGSTRASKMSERRGVDDLAFDSEVSDSRSENGEHSEVGTCRIQRRATGRRGAHWVSRRAARTRRGERGEDACWVTWQPRPASVPSGLIPSPRCGFRLQSYGRVELTFALGREPLAYLCKGASVHLSTCRMCRAQS